MLVLKSSKVKKGKNRFMIKNLSAKERIVLALDVDTLEEAKELVCELKDYVGMFKVGLQLFTAVGPDVFKMIEQEGSKVYFDGKYHDIPNTVAKACANLVRHDVDFFNINIKGSSKMIAKSVRLVKETARRLEKEPPVMLGVTLLTSFGQRTLTEELGVSLNIDDYNVQLAKIAKENGLNGVVATADETRKIKEELGDDFIVLCPAVRPTWSIVNDQVRVVTPTDAIKAGVDYIVVGRPITSSQDRVAAAQLIIDEIEAASDSLMVID